MSIDSPVRSVSEGDAESFGRMNQLAIYTNQILFADGFLKRNTYHIGMMVGDHLSEATFKHKLHGFHPELRSQNTVKGNRGTATLEMSQNCVANVMFNPSSLQVVG